MTLKLVQALPVEKLYAHWDANRIPWENSNDIPKNTQKKPAQPRALSALTLALTIKNNGYNVYLAGESDLGRTYMLSHYLSPLAKKAETPPDLIYINNFENLDKPLLLKLPAGQGKSLKSSLSKALQQVRKELPARFETEAYEKKKGELLKKFQVIREQLIKKMDNVAESQGFNLDMDDQGSLTLYPLVEGKRLSEDEFEKLDTSFRASLKHKGDSLLQAMTGPVRKLTHAERDFKNNQRGLEREVVSNLLNRFLSPLAEKACKQANGCAVPLQRFFDAMRADILENIDLFLPKDTMPSISFSDLTGGMSAPQENSMYRYDINLFVDNSETKGAPIVSDPHPTFANLLGCVERESEMGALVTNFTLIKAGSLHKANGGYLFLHVEDILTNPNAWEGLMRALRSSCLRVEDPTDGLEFVRTKGIEPEALELNLKVILIGQNAIYESLLENDDRFAKLFKMKAQMSGETDRTAPNVKAWLLNLAPIILEAGLLPFNRDAMAALVDYGTLLCEDHKKLSLKFPLVREAMIEASAIAQMEGLKLVDKAIIDKALAERMYRSAYIEELFMEEYDRDIIKIQTSGTAIGQVNGLSITSTGHFEFGLPHQISCTVGVGHGGIIDLEREAELGGPIHTKAMMILKSYLVDQFAHNKPLVLTGSLCFEQSYNGIEGDSASGAELVSLLSAIAQVPIKLSLSITGAISQAGAILPVGGVTRKIEGYFNLCNRRGLTGEQGVIIPKDNIEHLMLSKKVMDAVAENKFSIYAVKHITEALELLTNMPTGKRRKNGTFPEGTLFHAVDTQLHELGWLAENSFKTRRKKKPTKAKTTGKSTEKATEKTTGKSTEKTVKKPAKNVNEIANTTEDKNE